jgi:hypothetical protein
LEGNIMTDEKETSKHGTFEFKGKTYELINDPQEIAAVPVIRYAIHKKNDEAVFWGLLENVLSEDDLFSLFQDARTMEELGDAVAEQLLDGADAGK